MTTMTPRYSEYTTVWLGVTTRYEALKIILEALREKMGDHAAKGNKESAKLIQEAMNYMVVHDRW